MIAYKEYESTANMHRITPSLGRIYSIDLF